MSSSVEPVQLIEAVAQLLRDKVMPALDGDLAFEVRVSVNALELAARAIRQPPTVCAERRSRLGILLGEDASAEKLEARLCEAIRSGAIDEASAALIDHLRLAAIEDVKVDQPRYSALRQVLGTASNLRP